MSAFDWFMVAALIAIVCFLLLLWDMRDYPEQGMDETNDLHTPEEREKSRIEGESKRLRAGKARHEEYMWSNQ